MNKEETMEGGGSAGRDIPTPSKTLTPGKKHKSREHYNDSTREIDQQHLANLLRESAEVVERGEFQSILYEALQDFRTYYKQKYPKTSKKKKSSRRTSAGSQASEYEITEKVNSENSEILNDLKETEENTAEASGTLGDGNAKQDPGGETPYANRASTFGAEPAGEINSNTESAGEYDPDTQHRTNTGIFVASGGASARFDDGKVSDENENPEDKERPKPADGESISAAAPVPTANLSMAPPSVNTVPAKSTTTTTTTTTTTIAPSETSIPMGSTGADPNYPGMGTPTPTRPPAVPVAFTTPQSHNRAAVFGKKFNLGASFKNVKKAAEIITENITGKHHHRPGSDIGIFSESGIGMAEASNRRESLSDDCGMKEFKSRVTTGKAGASTAAAVHHASEHYEYEYNIQKSNSHDEHSEKEKQNFFEEGGTAPPHSSVNRQGPAVFESQRFGKKTSQVYNNDRQQQIDSAAGVPGGESGGNHDSEAEGIKGGLSGSSGATDPIMKFSGGVMRSKPSFQFPANKDSTLIASGWIEQFRRSKMRYVWKDVLASLVEGRNPGEVTTLWIQREIINPSTGRPALEALHRIPVKLLQDVSLTENSSDNQFRLRLYGGTEDFVFRCSEAPHDSLRWVQILKKHEQLSKGAATNGTNGYHEEKKAGAHESSVPTQQKQKPTSTKGMPIRDLRAMCHGAGVNTAGMERAQLEAAAEEIQQQGTYFDQRGTPTAPTQSPSPKIQQYATQQQPQQQQQPQPLQYPQEQTHSAQPELGAGNVNQASTEQIPPQQEQQQPEQKRLGIKELRAICHGAGISTAGMERRELEAAANEVQSRGTFFANAPSAVHTPAAVQTPSEEEVRARQEEYRRQQEELKRRQESEAALKRHQQEVEEGRRRAAELEARRQEEARRRAIEEEQRRRAAEDEARRRAAADEARRRAAAEEQARRQREAQAARERYAQQQAVWQQQQQAEQQRRHMAEQQAAQERRRREEAMRKEQEWAAPAPGVYPQQQWQQQQQQQQQQQYQAYPPQQHPTQQQWQQQQQQQRPTPPQQNTRSRTPPPQQQQRQNSGTDNKYAQMANQSEDDGQAAITKIKHAILIQWALQPPQLQMLRPIAGLVTTIHTVFPPALGVAGHEYFQKWKPISREDVAGVNGLPEESKLKKSVRKIRFFLHPDKLPHDLNEEQKFTVKMLWDVTNDSWEEYQKHKDDLDWVN